MTKADTLVSLAGNLGDVTNMQQEKPVSTDNILPVHTTGTSFVMILCDL